MKKVMFNDRYGLTGEPAFFWKTGFIKVSSCVLWRRFAKCEQVEDKE